MTFGRSLRNAAVTGIAAFLAACAAPDLEDPAIASSALAHDDATVEPVSGKDADARGQHRGKRGKRGKLGKRGKGGPDGMLHAALAKASLSSEQQKQVDEIFADAKDEAKESFGARKQVNALLAKAAADGRIDDAEVAGVRSAAESAAVKRAKAMSDAIVELHATLTPEQRKAVADAFGDRMAKGKRGHGKKGERAMGHHKKGPKGTMGDKRGMRGGKGFAGHKGSFLARGLDLSDAQRAALKEQREKSRPNDAQKSKRMEDFRGHLDSLRSAFVADRLDPTALGLEERAKKRAAAGVDRQVNELRALLSVVDADQRAKLIKRLEQ